MNTRPVPSQFFQTLGELESHLAMVEHLAKDVCAAADHYAIQHEQRNVLNIHLHYMRDSIKYMEKTRLRFNLLRRYFVPEITKP